jgi:gamma-glutamyl:cysteine ligase YbdK (ATP-grasp superfamily)
MFLKPKKEIKFLRSKIVELAAKQDLIVGGAGTHPFLNGRSTHY